MNRKTQLWLRCRCRNFLPMNCSPLTKEGLNFCLQGCFFEEVKIGEYSGVYIDWGKEGVDYGSVIWADDDYVLELYGNLTKDELLYLANGTKSLGK